jgi:hypothetical protein
MLMRFQGQHQLLQYRSPKHRLPAFDDSLSGRGNSQAGDCWL